MSEFFASLTFEEEIEIKTKLKTTFMQIKSVISSIVPGF